MITIQKILEALDQAQSEVQDHNPPNCVFDHISDRWELKRPDNCGRAKNGNDHDGLLHALVNNVLEVWKSTASYPRTERGEHVIQVLSMAKDIAGEMEKAVEALFTNGENGPSVDDLTQMILQSPDAEVNLLDDLVREAALLEADAVNHRLTFEDQLEFVIERMGAEVVEKRVRNLLEKAKARSDEAELNLKEAIQKTEEAQLVEKIRKACEELRRSKLNSEPNSDKT